MASSNVFISYARNDAANLAQRLRQDLASEGFDIWLDTQRMSMGESWTVAIENAIDRSNVVLALLSPGSYRSEICRAEQLRSLRKGKCVIAVLVVEGTDIPLHLEPKNYCDFTSPTIYAEQFRVLLADIDGRRALELPERYRATQVTYITTPPTVVNELGRPEVLRALRDTIFAAHDGRSVAITALEGMGGIGKTVLAQALVAMKSSSRHFRTGSSGSQRAANRRARRRHECAR